MTRTAILAVSRVITCGVVLVFFLVAASGSSDGASYNSATSPDTTASSRAFYSATSQEAANHTVSGFVLDEESGENLIGATVYAPYLRIGTTTNRYGFFSLTVEADSVTLAVSHIGYASSILHRRLEGDIQINVLLRPENVTLDELEVTAQVDESSLESTQMSMVNLQASMIEALPVLAGEVDIMKTLQLIPGVQSGREATSGLYVRGGGPDQNLILLDGVPVYNVMHLFGFLSVFNTQAIKDVTLIKGGFPARYGGRLASVIDLSMKEGNLKEFQGSASIGLIASSVTVEGPIKKDRASFLVAARRTYLDLLVYPFMKKGQKTGYYFYDLSAKTNYIVSQRDRFYLSLYTGHDRGYRRYKEGESNFSESNELDLGWRNLTLTGRWNRVLGPRFFMNALVGYTRYRLQWMTENTISDSTSSIRELSASKYLSGIADRIGKLDFEWSVNPSHYVRFGFGGIAHTYNTGALSQRQKGQDIASIDTLHTPNHRFRSIELSAYVEDDLRLSSRLKVNAGVHASSQFGGGRQYHSVQPRLSLNWRLSRTAALKASIAAMRQYIHLLASANGFALPLDLWVPATDRVRPQSAWQAATGLTLTFKDGRYELAIESYFKKMRHLVEYKEGASYVGATSGSWQDLVEQGEGRSFGGELLIQKKIGRLTGWLGYSLTRTNRKFANLNDGGVFPFRYDRLHDLSAVVKWRWKESIELASTWVYGTGQAIWLPIGHFYGIEHEPGGADVAAFGYGRRILRVYGPRNASRMPAYHRFDLAMHWTRNRARTVRTLSWGVYNAYNRKNPFILESRSFVGEDREEKYLIFKKISLFPVLPFVTYRLDF